MSATPSKLCQQCGALFYRPAHVGNKQWARRHFCSLKCAQASRAHPGASKPCQQCGKLLFYRSSADGSRNRWEAKRFCSNACTHAAKRTAIPTGSIRNCEECGSAYAKRYDRPGAWLKRCFCSRACANTAKERKHRAALPDIRTAFESRIKKTTGCWLWQGSKTGGSLKPYGLFVYAGIRYAAHVFALKLDGWPVPPGKRGLHHCDVKLCVRPSHLYVGTPKMNIDDAWQRSRTDYGAQHFHAKLTPEDVLEMRRMREQGISFKRIARAFNISTPAATAAVLGKIWKRGAPFNADDLARLKQIRTIPAPRATKP
jgi:hypothetical protein